MVYVACVCTYGVCSVCVCTCVRVCAHTHYASNFIWLDKWEREREEIGVMYPLLSCSDEDWVSLCYL